MSRRRFVVENTGNVEHTFHLRYRPIAPDGIVADTGENGVEEVTLAPGERRSISLDWEIADDADAGEYDIGVEVWNSSEYEEPITNAVEPDAVSVVQTQDGTIQNLFGPSSFESGDTQTFEVRISNPTSVRQKYTLEATAGGNVEFADGAIREVELDAGESRNRRHPSDVLLRNQRQHGAHRV